MSGEKLYKNLPTSPGVYLMKDRKGKILYIGKAANLKRRVASYFIRAGDSRIEKLVRKVAKVNCRKTESVLEALILESKLIKEHQPLFNVREKDDKSFLYIEITDEKFPRVLLVRGQEANQRQSARNQRKSAELFGPFVSASAVREALRILRRIFPWGIHSPRKERGTTRNGRGLTRNSFSSRPCFDYQIGLCPGTCIGAISRRDYLRNIRNLKLILAGKKKELLGKLEREMRGAARKKEFEKAEKLKRQIFALKHIQDTALISDSDSQLSGVRGQVFNLRIEGYDISSISGTSAVGAMVVFANASDAKPRIHANTANSFKPVRSEYRKFKIRTVFKPDDTGMIKEVIARRFKRDWPLPDLILIDGGRGQVSAVKDILREGNLVIPVVGIAKGARRKKNEIVASESAYRMRPPELSLDEFRKLLIEIRDEAHRFAISYHRKLRGKML